MRRHPKAPSAGSISNRSTRRPKLLLPLAAVLLVSLILGVSLATATAPTVTIEAASGVGYVTATAKGTVDPGDHETSYRFRYATQAQFEAGEFAEAASSTELSLPEGSGPMPVQAELSGLAPNTTYHLRLEAANSDGTRQAVAPETFTTKEVARPSVSIDAPSSITTSSAQLSGQVNPNGTDPAFDTHWELECAPSCFDFFDPQRQGDIPADESNHPVAAEATGLQPGTEYTLTLSATNAGGTETAQTAFTTQAAAPSIDPLAHTSGVSQTGATLHAKVDPNGAETSYRFEWGTDASYGASVPVPGKSIGSGSDPAEVSQAIEGLQPDTTYHYRVVASSSVGTAEGSDHLFRTQAPPSPTQLGQYPGQGFLPDNRSWEMVSPPEKNGGEVTLGSGSIRASSLGDAVVFDSNVGFLDAQGTGEAGAITYRADRASPRWSSRSLLPRQAVDPSAIFGGQYFASFASDLSRAVLISKDPPLVPAAPAGIANIYVTNGNGILPELLTLNLSGGGISPNPVYTPFFDGASTDFTRIFFESTIKLTPNAVPNVLQLYEWHDGSLSLVGILPDSACDAPPCIAPSGVEAGLGGFSDREPAVSDDGSRVYFTDSTQGRLYLRKNATNTVSVNDSESTSPDSTPQTAHFWGASTDGRRALFTSGERLLDADQNPSSDVDVGGESSDLYLYEDSAQPESDSNLTLISADHEPTDGVTTGVQGVLGTSSDESFVYFTADRRLVNGQDPISEAAPAIYLWHDGKVRYVAPIGSGLPDSLNWAQTAIQRTSRVSDNGKSLLYSTGFPQHDGYDNTGHVEIYRYDALGEARTCLSCDPKGTPAGTEALLTFPGAEATKQYQPYAARSLSTDGRRVFFSTGDALVPEDTNRRYDAYEWEEDGKGSCHKPQGCLFLLSSGKGVGDSYFADASADGSDAYIVTEDPLSGWDKGGGFERDLYVARVGGGVPEPALAPASCEGDACQPSPAALKDATPASSGFAGPGNQAKKAEKARKHRRKKHRGVRHHRTQTTTREHG